MLKYTTGGTCHEQAFSILPCTLFNKHHSVSGVHYLCVSLGLIWFPFDIWALILIFLTPEEFTTTVANKGLEKARAYLNQVSWDSQLNNAPFEGSMMSLKET